MALVYTHLDTKWLDPETRRIRSSIENRLRYLASKRGWFAPASAILDRTAAMSGLKLYRSGARLTIGNRGRERIDGVTILSKRRRALTKDGRMWHPDAHGEIVIGTVLPGAALSFTIM
jgi:hypothetical protein